MESAIAFHSAPGLRTSGTAAAQTAPALSSSIDPAHQPEESPDMDTFAPERPSAGTPAFAIPQYPQRPRNGQHLPMQELPVTQSELAALRTEFLEALREAFSETSQLFHETLHETRRQSARDLEAMKELKQLLLERIPSGSQSVARRHLRQP